MGKRRKKNSNVNEDSPARRGLPPEFFIKFGKYLSYNSREEDEYYGDDDEEDDVLTGTQTNYRNFTINDKRTLITVEQVSADWKMEKKALANPRKKTSDDSVKKLRLKLKEISVEELKTYRKAHIPFFVLKEYDRYYITEIPRELNFLSATFIGEHLCGKIRHECDNLDPLLCQKVYDRNKYIENYPYIKVGYETANAVHEVFNVCVCDCYKTKNPEIQDMN